MQVQIVLDHPQAVWTNLDVFKGQVLLRLPSTSNVTSVIVKLEGESKTRLLTQANRDLNERPSAREETHKVLYKTLQVFPPGAVAGLATSNQRHFTLSPGQYEYPFEFKIPFNNTCGDVNAPGPSNASIGLANLSSLANLRVKGLDAPNRHVKTTLPPTLTAFPGLAEIRYYLKVTVNRKEFYKENPRVLLPFNFLPVEPPRPQAFRTETFARRQHSFTKDIIPKPSYILGNFRKRANQAATEPPHFSIDARLPNPAIITCNEDIPLRVVLKRLNRSAEVLYLQSLQIQLVAHTRINAQEICRDEANSWIVVNHNNLRLPLKSNKNGGVGEQNEEIVLETQPWRDRPLPSSVAPSFDSCNISRKYELLIQVGIGWGIDFAKNCFTIPLRHGVHVYSGIKPPEALLAAMSTAAPVKKPLKSASVNAPPHLRESYDEGGPSISAQSPQPGPSYMSPTVEDEEEPPPSYEDTVGQELPPIDGQRRMYEPPPVRQGAGAFAMDKS